MNYENNNEQASKSKNSRAIVKPKLDVVFKMLFGTQESLPLLRALLSALLSIPKKDITEIMLKNVELIPDDYDNKFSRLDLNLEVNGKKINIELQICSYDDYAKRNLFYWARNYTNDLKSGHAYGELKETICINILGFDMFECKEYHSHFQVIETTRHEILTDALSIHYFELNKAAAAEGDSEMLQWLHLINAETEDDLMVIEQTDIQEIKDAVIKIRELSEDEKAKQAAFQREMDLFEKEMFYNKLNKVSADYNQMKVDYDKAKEESEQKDKIIEELISEKEKQFENMKDSFIRLVREGKLSVAEAASCAGMSTEEFEKLMNTEA